MFGITFLCSLDFTTEQIILGTTPQLIINFLFNTAHMCLTNPLIAHICHYCVTYEIRLCHLYYLLDNYVDSKSGASMRGKNLSCGGIKWHPLGSYYSQNFSFVAIVGVGEIIQVGGIKNAVIITAGLCCCSLRSIMEPTFLCKGMI